MDFSFPKKDRLCQKRRFDALLAQGNSFFIYPFRVIWLCRDEESGSVPVQIAISVRKKQFKRAVWRNLIKRRFREAWRLNRRPLTEQLIHDHQSLYVLMVYGANEILPYPEIELRLKQVVKRLMEETKMGKSG
jgi:ribonuclease P protein component